MTYGEFVFIAIILTQVQIVLIGWLLWRIRKALKKQ